MKKFLLATSALILIAAAQPAYAADQSALPHLPSKTAIVPPAAIYNWNGCYIGAHGGGRAVSDTFVAGGGLNSENFLHGGSGFAGGQLGCNVQNGVMVLGFEAEAWSGLTNAANFSSSMFTRNRWSADVAVRTGLAFDRALVYGKAGIADGRFAFSGSNTSGFLENGASTLTGVLLGVGLEYGFAPNWSAKLEYDHIEYAGHGVHFHQDAPDGGPFDHSHSASANLINAGINYRFGGPSLPPATDGTATHGDLQGACKQGAAICGIQLDRLLCRRARRRRLDARHQHQRQYRRRRPRRRPARLQCSSRRHRLGCRGRGCVVR